MIGKLHGTIEEISGNKAYIRVSDGVSYLVMITPTVASKKDKAVSLYTHLDVREDALNLYGFETHLQYNLYLKLISVDGIGPKLGFNIICFAKSEEIIKAAQTSDVAFFQAIPGIGKKTAQRILVDLSGTLGGEFNLSSITLSQEDTTVVAALVQLGFNRNDIHKAIQKVNSNLSIEEKIRKSIQLITGK